MGSLQWKLEQRFCPSIDSTLIAAIVGDYPDFESCFEILSSLEKEADAERDFENEISSGNSSSNLRNSSSGEPGDGSTTSIEYSTYSPSVEDELDYYSSAYTTDYEDYEYPKGNTEFLKNMFPMIPESRVNNLLREKDNNVEMVVDVILNEMYLQTEQDDDFSYSRSTSTLISNSDADNSLLTDVRNKNPESQNELIDDNKLCQLMEIFPNHNFESIKQTLVNCNGEVQNATEILSSGDLNDSKKQIKVIKLISHTSEHQDTHLQNKERRGSITNDSNKEAFKCFKKRDESFKKAAQSYRRGQGSVASYHSEEGWRFDAEMKKWKLRAARSLVKKHSEKTQYEYVLDLHGCFVTEAIIIVKEWLNDWYPKRTRSASQMKPSQMKPLKIITGKGNHSPNGVAKLPNAINKFLIGDNWNITKHTGHVLVHGLKK
ncbi:4805_t:CDS:2 [Rhizophagus irregularis]|nr:4805_t:CDS:2 [Rhizophagus irregularis]